MNNNGNNVYEISDNIYNNNNNNINNNNNCNNDEDDNTKSINNIIINNNKFEKKNCHRNKQHYEGGISVRQPKVKFYQCVDINEVWMKASH